MRLQSRRQCERSVMWGGDMKRSVWRKRGKWVGLVLSIMLLGLWVFSAMFQAHYVPPNGNWRIATSYGDISFSPASQWLNPGWMCRPQWSSLAEHMRWTQVAHLCLGFRLPSKNNTTFHMPLWLLVAATGYPTAFRWYRDRRPKAGFCTACKYDLTGNESGTCPECGTAIKQSPAK